MSDHEPHLMLKPPADDLILRYFAGKLNDHDAERVRLYFEASSELRGVHDGLRHVMQSDILGHPPDTDAEIQRLLQRVDAEREATKRQRPPTPSDALPIAMRKTRGPSHRWRGARVVAALCVAVALTVAIIKRDGFMSRTGTPDSVTMRELATQPGQLMTMQLSDGSVVTLAPQTRLRISPAFGVDNRDIVLDGEAYFDIATRSNAPFIVHTRRSVVRVLGTRFDVRAFDTSTAVAVVNGKVSLASDRAMAPSLIVTADHVGLIAANGEARIHQDDMTQYTEWTRGRLVFRNTPVPEVLERLSRWYGVQMSTMSPALARKQLYADWQGRSIESVLELLSDALNARVMREGDQVMLYAR